MGNSYGLQSSRSVGQRQLASLSNHCSTALALTVFLDTETTGLSLEDGHRIVSIGATLVEDGLHTGEEFHELINPQHEIDPEATEIHGLTQEDLRDKPTFPVIADRFIQFVDGKEVCIHNAAFDVGFLDQELELAGYPERMAAICQVTDSMELAKELHPTGLVNLDTLCNKYGVDKTERDKHGALLDAQLLSEVYLKMQSSQISLLSDIEQEKHERNLEPIPISFPRSNVRVVRANSQEIEAHEAYMRKLAETSSE